MKNNNLLKIIFVVILVSIVFIGLIILYYLINKDSSENQNKYDNLNQVSYPISYLDNLTEVEWEEIVLKKGLD